MLVKLTLGFNVLIMFFLFSDSMRQGLHGSTVRVVRIADPSLRNPGIISNGTTCLQDGPARSHLQDQFPLRHRVDDLTGLLHVRARPGLGHRLQLRLHGNLRPRCLPIGP